jgi:hypothetical protein
LYSGVSIKANKLSRVFIPNNGWILYASRIIEPIKLPNTSVFHPKEDG